VQGGTLINVFAKSLHKICVLDAFLLKGFEEACGLPGVGIDPGLDDLNGFVAAFGIADDGSEVLNGFELGLESAAFLVVVAAHKFAKDTLVVPALDVASVQVVAQGSVVDITFF